MAALVGSSRGAVLIGTLNGLLRANGRVVAAAAGVAGSETVVSVAASSTRPSGLAVPTRSTGFSPDSPKEFATWGHPFLSKIETTRRCHLAAVGPRGPQYRSRAAVRTSNEQVRNCSRRLLNQPATPVRPDKTESAQHDGEQGWRRKPASGRTDRLDLPLPTAELVAGIDGFDLVLRQVDRGVAGASAASRSRRGHLDQQGAALCGGRDRASRRAPTDRSGARPRRGRPTVLQNRGQRGHDDRRD